MTDLKKIKDNPKDYWLGEVVKIHEISNIQIVEYKEKSFKNDSTHGVETGKHGFSIFINEKSTSHSTMGLDSAIICALAEKYDGLNTQAGHFFCKMVAIVD